MTFKLRNIVVAASVVLCLSAVGAASASAAWFVGGTELAAGSSAALASLPVIHESLILHFKSGTTSIAVLCESVHIINGRILPPNMIFVGALDFLHCHSIAPTPTSCQLKGGDTLIKTEPLLATVTLTRQTFKPETGKLFAELKYEEGTSCVLESSLAVKGEVTIGTPHGATESVNQEAEGLGELENNQLQVGINPAYLLGRILVALASGTKWAFK